MQTSYAFTSTKSSKDTQEMILDAKYNNRVLKTYFNGSNNDNNSNMRATNDLGDILIKEGLHKLEEELSLHLGGIKVCWKI